MNGHVLQNDVEVLGCFDEALVLDDVRMLWQHTQSITDQQEDQSGEGVDIR
jgi:hypothetical protein